MAMGDAAAAEGIAGDDGTFDAEVLLSALARVFGEAVIRFGDISGRVTENVLASAHATDHDLIVALQDFDRLQQEFAALGDVLSYCVADLAGSARRDDATPEADPIAAITLAELKAVLRDRARNEAIFLATRPGCAAEDVF